MQDLSIFLIAVARSPTGVPCLTAASIYPSDMYTVHTEHQIWQKTNEQHNNQDIYLLNNNKKVYLINSNQDNKTYIYWTTTRTYTYRKLRNNNQVPTEQQQESLPNKQ